MLALWQLVNPAFAAGPLSWGPPPEWPAPQYAFEKNPVTRAGFALGRELFYDPLLSRDGSVSCGSCHQQSAAFANRDHRLSHGVEGRLGKRNAPALFNLAWAPRLMWDGAAGHLETQAILPLANPAEMDASLAQVVDRLAASQKYQRLFEDAFGDAPIDSQHMLRALAQFTGSLISDHSAYDAYTRGQASLSADALAGLGLFRKKCSSCHVEPLFTDYSFRSNGVDAGADPGRAGVTSRAADEGLFRVPSLRNVALTAPYMHDGRFATLDEVLDHYDHGIAPSAKIDPVLSGGVSLDPAQRRQVLAFLGALTDTSFVSDARLSEPQPEIQRPSAWTKLLQWLAPTQSIVAASSASASPSLALESAHWQLVARHRGNDLAVYIDDASTNEPASGLALRLRLPDGVLHAVEEAPGLYTVPADSLDAGGDIRVQFVLSQNQIEEILEGLLPPHRLAVEAAAAGSVWTSAIVFGAFTLPLAWLLRRVRFRFPLRSLSK